MATVTGLTAARMLEIEAMSIVNGAVDLSTGVLTLQRHDGSTVVAGNVRGVGLQSGGTAGQAFVKKSAADYDAEWQDVVIDGDQVTTGKVPISRLAHHDMDSSNGRIWQTTDSEGRWGVAGQTAIVLSPMSDVVSGNAMALSIDGATIFGVSKTGELTYGTVPAARVDKLRSEANHTYILGKENAEPSNSVALLVDAGADSGAGAFGFVSNGNYRFRVNSSGVMTHGVIPYARLETPLLLAFSGSNLNSNTSTGVWHQPSNAGASAGSNYPTSLAGLLEVFSYGGFVYQRYTTYGYRNISAEQDPRSARVYTRALYDGGWSGWQAISKQGHAAGRVLINVTANTIGSAYVAFPSGKFNTGIPAVTATVHSGAANGRSVSISDPTTGGVTIYLWSSHSVTNSVSWIAQEAG